MALIEHCTKRIILASASPRRQALFKLICDNFEIIESQIDESKVVAQKPHDVVVELAQCKAISVAQTVQDGLIIGADSVVVLDDEILGKPSCEAEARAMLQKLSGRYHTVFTGFSILRMPENMSVEGYEETVVKFKKLSDWEIQRYIEVGEPFDKAGAYGIQNEAALFVERINGCYYNVMGLPVASLYKALQPIIFTSDGETHD